MANASSAPSAVRSSPSDAAYDSRTPAGSPNASPGTSASFRFLSSSLQNSVDVPTVTPSALSPRHAEMSQKT